MSTDRGITQKEPNGYTASGGKRDKGMSDLPNVSLDMADIALQVGALVLKAWQADKQVRALEAQVQALTPTAPPPVEGSDHA